MSSLAFAATSLMRAPGPNEDRRDQPGLRGVHCAPASDPSSQGCATAVGVGGSDLHLAIRRSYLACAFSIMKLCL